MTVKFSLKFGCFFTSFGVFVLNASRNVRRVTDLYMTLHASDRHFKRTHERREIDKLKDALLPSKESNIGT